MTKTNVQSIPSNSQRHDTPNNKTHIIKFRVTAEEKASLELTCKLLNAVLPDARRNRPAGAVGGGYRKTETADRRGVCRTGISPGLTFAACGRRTHIN